MFTINEKEYHILAKYIREHYGINLKDEKIGIVASRLQNLLQKNNFKSFSEYYKYVFSDKSGEAVTELINKITTNHTFFMREGKHFDYFKEQVLPFFTKNFCEKDLRIWSAGCSTGEEPATLAMIIDEFFGLHKIGWDTKILATDISARVLNIAQKGVYHNEKISLLPANWKSNYFKKIDFYRSVLIDKIKDEIVYRKFNLVQREVPFKKKFHVIFCRNVMIYFDQATKMELVNRFYDLTESGGYLFIGHSESINREETKYKYIMPAVYQKE